MKVICGIITYYPNCCELKKNIAAIKKQVDHIVIVDNGSDNVDEIISLISADSMISMICNKKNYGVAVGLNQIMYYGKRHGYTWVLTLDQDTYVYPELISCYERYTKLPDVAMINCLRNDRNYYDYRFYQKKNAYDYERSCITSGTLTNAEKVIECGGFDNKMFIDLVDIDMCATLREHGYKIVCVNRIGYLHSLGHVTKVRIWGYDLKLYHYSPKRIYFYSRNLMYYLKKHRSDYGLLIGFVRLMVGSVFFETDRLRKLGAYLTGAVRGIFFFNGQE